MRIRSQLTLLHLLDEEHLLHIEEEERSLSGSFAFLVLSVVGHAAGFLLLFSGVLHIPSVRDVVSTGNYWVQKLSVQESQSRPPKKHIDTPQISRQQSTDVIHPDSPLITVPQEEISALPLPVVQSDETRVHTSALVEQPKHDAPTQTVVLSAANDEGSGLITDKQDDEQAAVPKPDEEVIARIDLSLASSSDEQNFMNVAIPASRMLASASALFPCVAESADAPAASDVLMTGRLLAHPSASNPCLPSSPQDVGGAQRALMADVNLPMQPATQGTVEHITLPKDGRFGVVVVGSTVSEDYPEARRIWRGRVAYTAFLHIGESRNWIMQYSPLRATSASTGGYAQGVEAPWPYDIMRPDFQSNELNLDALTLHGVVNQFGRFETLAVASPVHFTRAEFIVNTLRQWQFRPARQNGKDTAVEIVLIIPAIPTEDGFMSPRIPTFKGRGWQPGD